MGERGNILSWNGEVNKASSTPIALGGANLENLALFVLLVTDTCDQSAIRLWENNGTEVLLVAYF
jgi:hypothetical protein